MKGVWSVIRGQITKGLHFELLLHGSSGDDIPYSHIWTQQDIHNLAENKG